MKRIVVDARESGTSTGRYVDKLLEHMALQNPKYEIIVLTKKPRVDFIKSIAPSFRVVESNIKEFTFAEQIKFKKQIELLKPDLVHFMMVQQPIWYQGKKITTMHDLTTCRFNNPDKNFYVYKTKQQVYKWVNKKVARDSELVIAPSQYVKDDIADFTSVDENKIVVTYEAADKIPDKSAPVEVLQNKKFLMYIGRPTPHKNLKNLIRAFSRLNVEFPDLHLALAGKKDGNYLSIEAWAESNAVANLIFTDFVSDGQLRWMYEHCEAYVFPSLSEGFGLPGLEAMAHGAPVLSSNATCLPEVYGNSALYFNPNDTRDMATRIVELLKDESLKSRLVKAGSEQAAKYSWDKAARQTLEVYQKALAN